MGNLFADVRYAVRLLIKKPGFAAVAILTLALGIGATTAIFTVVHAVLLRPLPFRDADRLVQVRITGRNNGIFPLPDTDFLAWRSQNQTADAVAVSANERRTITGDGMAEQVSGCAVTDRFFDVLGTRPLFGRVFQPGDDKPDAPKSVVLSHALWSRRYHADPAIVGRVILIDAVPHTVIGVMPSDFSYPPGNPVLWRILTMREPARRGPFYTWGIARLKSGAGINELHANLGIVTADLKRRFPGPADWTLDALPLQDAVVGHVQTILYVLLGAVGFLLLIATANVANLLLARAAAREREIAVRGALGAGRARIVAQLITESVVLGVVSGIVGLGLAAWGTRALLALAPEGIPRLAEVRMSVPVFLFALGVASVCGLIFGVVPALRAARVAIVETLRDGGRGVAGGSHRRAQQILIVSEIALALMLSIGAGLMVRSFVALQRVSPGFEPSHLLTFSLSLPRTQYTDPIRRRDFYTALLQKLETLPGVQATALTISLPPHLLAMTDNFMVEGQVLPPNQSAPLGPLLFVNETYFSTLGAPLLRGRFFNERDDDKAPPVVIINETLAKQFFPGADPIGRRLKDGGPERPISATNQWMTIVGVVGDINYSGLDAKPEPAVYYPFRQTMSTTQYVVLRTAGDPRGLANGVRAVVADLDKDLPVADLRTMDDLMVEAVAPPRFRTLLVSMFALVGLALAALGIYGVMAYAVSQRTHELGVRMALGADRAAVLRMVLGEAMRLSAAGVGLGLVGAFLTSRLLRSLLFGVTPSDAPTFAAIVGLLAATALVASYIPARRATRVDPMVALRYE
jgi:putative ABC transport system permease protein